MVPIYSIMSHIYKKCKTDCIYIYIYILNPLPLDFFSSFNRNMIFSEVQREDQ